MAVLTQPIGSPSCGMTVRRITDLEEEENEPTASSVPAQADTMKGMSGTCGPEAAGYYERFGADEEVARFRGVRIISKQVKHSTPSGLGSLLAPLFSLDL